MNFGKNIKLLRNRRGRTQDDIATVLKMKRSTLSGYENGISQPDIESLISFSEFFNVAVDTLIKVDMSLLSESQLSEIERGYDVYVKGSKLRVLTTTVDSQNKENIELVPEKAKAGYLRGFADPEYIRELPRFSLPFLSRDRKYRSFQIDGDSMLPIPEGSWVTGEYVQDWTSLRSKQAYIILTLDEGIVFKIVENNLSSNNSLRLFSLNPLYKPYYIEVSQIKEIWRFVHYISAKIPDPKLAEEELMTTVTSLKRDVERLKNMVFG